MRKVSYTQMRAELSDILDAIRNGETVVVTQRGRPDTVLNGSLVNSGLTLREKSSSERGTPHIKTYIVESHLKDGTVVHAKYSPKVSGTRLENVQIVKTSFREALHKTQQKHAKIIKALEDK